MKLFGRHASGRGGQRLGAVLALLALLCQMVVSALPMPAMAGTALAPDGSPICQFDASGKPVAPNPADGSGHHLPSCPVCQAAQLLGSLLPPPPPAAPVVLPAATDEFRAVGVARPARFVADRPPVRGPPSQV
jgi:hypothetical protein